MTSIRCAPPSPSVSALCTAQIRSSIAGLGLRGVKFPRDREPAKTLRPSAEIFFAGGITGCFTQGPSTVRDCYVVAAAGADNGLKISRLR